MLGASVRRDMADDTGSTLGQIGLGWPLPASAPPPPTVSYFIDYPAEAEAALRRMRLRMICRKCWEDIGRGLWMDHPCFNEKI